VTPAFMTLDVSRTNMILMMFFDFLPLQLTKKSKKQLDCNRCHHDTCLYSSTI